MSPAPLARPGPAPARRRLARRRAAALLLACAGLGGALPRPADAPGAGGGTGSAPPLPGPEPGSADPALVEAPCGWEPGHAARYRVRLADERWIGAGGGTATRLTLTLGLAVLARDGGDGYLVRWTARVVDHDHDRASPATRRAADALARSGELRADLAGDGTLAPLRVADGREIRERAEAVLGAYLGGDPPPAPRDGDLARGALGPGRFEEALMWLPRILLGAGCFALRRGEARSWEERLEVPAYGTSLPVTATAELVGADGRAAEVATRREAAGPEARRYFEAKVRALGGSPAALAARGRPRVEGTGWYVVDVTDGLPGSVTWEWLEALPGAGASKRITFERLTD